MGAQGPPGINGTDGAQGPPWTGSSIYAASIAEKYGNIKVTPNQPLAFDYFVNWHIIYTPTRMTVEYDGRYQISVFVYNERIESSITASIWKNGVPIPGKFLSFMPV